CPGGSPGGALICQSDCQCPGASSTTTSSTGTTATTSSSTGTTETTTSTTSTTLTRCGDGTIDPGEECDPPGSATCPGGRAGGAPPCRPACQCPAVTSPPSSSSSSTTVTTASTSSSTSTTMGSVGGAFVTGPETGGNGEHEHEHQHPGHPEHPEHGQGHH